MRKRRRNENETFSPATFLRGHDAEREEKKWWQKHFIDALYSLS
jgi:hypothetical protein